MSWTGNPYGELKKLQSTPPPPSDSNFSQAAVNFSTTSTSTILAVGKPTTPTKANPIVYNPRVLTTTMVLVPPFTSEILVLVL